MTNGNYNTVVEDQRNIVEIIHEEPNYVFVTEGQQSIVEIVDEQSNTVVVTVPGVSSLSARTNVTYGEGAPWTITVTV
jgi:precorrin-6x reductase